MINVCIVDDHQLIREGLASLLEDEAGIYLTGLYKCAEDLLFNVAKNIPDVILMDINLPHINGLTLCNMVMDKYPEVKVIGLSNNDQLSIIKNVCQWRRRIRVERCQ